MEIPEYFVDNIEISCSPGGGMLILGQQMHPSLGSGRRIHCVVRMDLIQTKVLAIQLKRTLKRFEAEQAQITIPPPVMGQLGISAEDWI